jgi:hypothetical protein
VENCVLLLAKQGKINNADVQKKQEKLDMPGVLRVWNNFGVIFMPLCLLENCLFCCFRAVISVYLGFSFKTNNNIKNL